MWVPETFWNRNSGTSSGSFLVGFVKVRSLSLSLSLCPTTPSTTTTTLYTDVYWTDLMVLEVAMALRYVPAPRDSHIPAVQGLWITPPAILR